MSLATQRVVIACCLCRGAGRGRVCRGIRESRQSQRQSCRLQSGGDVSVLPAKRRAPCDQGVLGRTHGQAGDFCTITSSNLDAIEVGSRVVYAQAADFGTFTLDSDVVLDPPGPGNNIAFGHCHLNLVTGIGLCTFSGGTGKFTHFDASVERVAAYGRSQLALGQGRTASVRATEPAIVGDVTNLH